MKKILSYLKILAVSMVAGIFLITCQNDVKIKSYTQTTYKAKFVNGEYTKDSIESKFTLGFYKEGSQKYFVGLVGFSYSDTIFYEHHPKKEVKKDGYNYIYKQDTLILITKIKKDTTFYCSLENRELCLYYDIYDSHNRLIKSYNDSHKESREYINKKFDKYGRTVYAVIKIEQLPLFDDISQWAPKEIENYKSHHQKWEIQETEYKYFGDEDASN